MLKPKEIVIDTEKTFKSDFIIVSVSPYYPYVDGKKSDSPSGYKVEVVLPKLRFEKISVVVPEIPFNAEACPSGAKIKFQNLNCSIYVINNSLGISAKADSIEIIK